MIRTPKTFQYGFVRCMSLQKKFEEAKEKLNKLSEDPGLCLPFFSFQFVFSFKMPVF